MRELNSENLARAKEMLRKAGYDVIRNCNSEVKSFDNESFQQYLDQHTSKEIQSLNQLLRTVLHGPFFIDIYGFFIFFPNVQKKFTIFCFKVKEVKL